MHSTRLLGLIASLGCLLVSAIRESCCSDSVTQILGL